MPLDECDPLTIAPANYLNYVIKDMKAQREDLQPEPQYTLTLAPDEVTKVDVSGGSYDIDLPFLGADPILEGFGTPFVDYLRICLEWGGFPGLRAYAKKPKVREFVAELTKDFVPF